MSKHDILTSVQEEAIRRVPDLIQEYTVDSPQQIEANGKKYLVLTTANLMRVQQSVLLETLHLNSVEDLKPYYPKDITPAELDVVLHGILLAPEGTISSYTKCRVISALINFDLYIQDSIESSPSGVILTDSDEKVTVVDWQDDDGEPNTVSIIELIESE